MIVTLDCRHLAPEKDVARDRRNRTMCFRCAYRNELAAFFKAGAGDEPGIFTGYLKLTPKGPGASGRGWITTWPGRPLARVYSWHMYRSNWGNMVVAWRAVDQWGRHWWGKSSGSGFYTTMRMTRTSRRGRGEMARGKV